jgi:hypothetical protein
MAPEKPYVRLTLSSARSLHRYAPKYIFFKKACNKGAAKHASDDSATCACQTIIECLRYATTGEYPPNTKNGNAFVHDPKACSMFI